MVTYESGGRSYSMPVIYGLSTDSKPTNVVNGSSFIEMDTGKLYFYDEANETWREWA